MPPPRSSRGVHRAGTSVRPAHPHLRLLPDISDAPGGRNSHRLVEAATGVLCRVFDVPQWIAVSALRSASRLAARPVRDVAAGVLLGQRLPVSLVRRVRRPAPAWPPTRPASTRPRSHPPRPHPPRPQEYP